MPGEPTDEELMLRVKAGDAQAFARLYERHKNGLLNFCYQMLRNWEDAADVFQEAFKYLYRQAADYRPTARFTTYLFQVARNRCIDILRKRKRWNLQSLDAAGEPSEDSEAKAPLERAEIEAQILKAMEEVQEPYREVIHLRVVENLPYEEIALILQCPLGTVKSRLHTGLEQLRQAVKRKRIED